MTPAPRRHRRAVGPPGAQPAVQEPLPADALGEGRGGDAEGRPDDRDDERLRADRPPHHDQGV